jgi:hypothetical protein
LMALPSFTKLYKMKSMKQVNKAKIFPWDEFTWTADSWRIHSKSDIPQQLESRQL